MSPYIKPGTVYSSYQNFVLYSYLLFSLFFQQSEDEAHDTQQSKVESLASEESADEV